MTMACKIMSTPPPPPGSTVGEYTAPQPAPAPPEPRLPADTTEAGSTSNSDWEHITYFAPPDESRGCDVIENVTIPSGYLNSAFIGHGDSSAGKVWISNGRATCHMTHDNSNTYDIRPSPPGSEAITVGNKRHLIVEYVSSTYISYCTDTRTNNTLR